MRLHPKYRRSLFQALTFGGIWALFGFMYVLLEKGILGETNYYPTTGNKYDFRTSLIFVPIGAFVMGFIQGLIEVVWLKWKFIDRPFWFKILVKGSLYTSLIVGFLAVLTIGINAVRYGASPLSEEVLNSFAQFFGDFSFWSIALYAGVVVDVALFFSEIKDFVGVNVYANYAFGKYHRPKREIRIFMFLDMKSSTTIAEKMGHAGYFNLIKSYYSEMTDAILETSGEIYQYVGDEIVVSWGQEEGLLKNNCVRCFEMIKLSMKNHETTFKDKHKFVPEFKAGLHIGEVTKGEIGTLKKEIIYTGDVLNTAARIQSLCNQYRASMLISGTLREQLTQSADYRFSEIGNITLRGKSTSLPIYRLEY